MSADAHGLRYFAKVSRDDPDGVALAVKMRNGVIKQSSMAFRCAADDVQQLADGGEDGPDVMLRRITQIGRLYDVCATPQGVFSQTVSELQQFSAPLLGQPVNAVEALREAIRVSPERGGAIPVSPETGGQVARRHELAQMRRRLAHIKQ